jgi:multicomponent Na+:H+ antiporter subunit D
MEVIHSVKPLLAVVVSLVGAGLILFTGEKHPNIRETWTILASLVKFSIVFSMLPKVLEGKVWECSIVSLAPGILLQFRVDAFGMFFGILASSLWIATSFFSIGYMRSLTEHSQTRYFFCFALALSATLGIAFAANLLTLFIFYEILTISTYPLVAHKEIPEAIMAGRKYLAYLMTADTLIFLSLGLTYHLTGSLDFVSGGFLEGHGSKGLLYLLFASFILGFGTKAAIIPMHEWLPTAMIAPTTVSALLHAVAVVKAGVFGCLRVILYVFGPKLLYDLDLWLILAYFVSFTIIMANMFALAQDNLKRRLAFSTINSLSIIILGAALLSRSAITGGILHIANHAFMKITLFFCAGAIYVKTHKENVSQLNGIGKQMPFTMSAFSIAAIGMVGIPPSCGFISKWYLCLGSLEAQELFFLGILLISPLLDAVYFFPIIFNSFFGTAQEGIDPCVDEAPMIIVAPLLVTAAISLILGVYPNAFYNFFQLSSIAVQGILGVQ